MQVLSVSSCRCEAVPPAASRGEWPLLTAADGRSVWWHPACKTRSANPPTQSAFTPTRSRISARSIPAAFTCFYLRGESLLHDSQTDRRAERQTGRRRTRRFRRGWILLKAGWRGAATRRSSTTTRCMCGEATRWVVKSLPVQVTRGKQSPGLVPLQGASSLSNISQMFATN